MGDLASSSNSSEAGRRFEEKVFAFFKREIANGRFPVRAECCKVFRQKGYYSKDRESDIVFDVAIEIYRPGSTSYAILMLIECKNYSHAVPVNDAEEFAEKVRQVAGAKGVIVSTGSFQAGTVNYCRSRHIGLVRHFHRKFDWILERTPSSDTQTSWTPIQAGDPGPPPWVHIHAGLLSNSHGNYNPDLYGCAGDAYSTSLDQFVRDLLSDVADGASILKPVERPTGSPRRLVEFVAREEIERQSAAVLEAVDYSGGAVPLDKICRWQSTATGLNVRLNVSADADDDSTHTTLGRIRFEPLEISIFDRANDHPARANFTLAHELGHHFLGHSKYIAGEYCEERDFDVDEPDGSADVGLADVRAMEWQANYFASCLLLPKQSLVDSFSKLVVRYDLRNKGGRYIYLDNQSCNFHDFYRVTNNLMVDYNVTRSVARIRLQALGLLTDGRRKSSR